MYFVGLRAGESLYRSFHTCYLLLVNFFHRVVSCYAFPQIIWNCQKRSFAPPFATRVIRRTLMLVKTILALVRRIHAALSDFPETIDTNIVTTYARAFLC